MKELLSLLLLATLLILETKSVIPPSYILNVDHDCGATLSDPTVVRVLTDLNIQLEVECLNMTLVVNSSDQVNYLFQIDYEGNHTTDCLFKRRENSKIWVVLVNILWSEPKGTIKSKREQYLVTCTLDPYAINQSDPHHTKPGMLGPFELQGRMGSDSASTIALQITNILGNPLLSGIAIGRKIRLIATMTPADGEQGVRAVSCNAIGGNISYAVLRGGCGDGIIFPRILGFTSLGMVVKSPFFAAFKLRNEPDLSFDCNFTSCVGNCDGNSCTNERKKRDADHKVYTRAVIGSSSNKMQVVRDASFTSENQKLDPLNILFDEFDEEQQGLRTLLSSTDLSGGQKLNASSGKDSKRRESVKDGDRPVAEKEEGNLETANAGEQDTAQDGKRQDSAMDGEQRKPGKGGKLLESAEVDERWESVSDDVHLEPGKIGEGPKSEDGASPLKDEHRESANISEHGESSKKSEHGESANKSEHVASANIRENVAIANKSENVASTNKSENVASANKSGHGESTNKSGHDAIKTDSENNRVSSPSHVANIELTKEKMGPSKGRKTEKELHNSRSANDDLLNGTKTVVIGSKNTSKNKEPLEDGEHSKSTDAFTNEDSLGFTKDIKDRGSRIEHGEAPINDTPTVSQTDNIKLVSPEVIEHEDFVEINEYDIPVTSTEDTWHVEPEPEPFSTNEPSHFDESRPMTVDEDSILDSTTIYIESTPNEFETSLVITSESNAPPTLDPNADFIVPNLNVTRDLGFSDIMEGFNILVNSIVSEFTDQPLDSDTELRIDDLEKLGIRVIADSCKMTNIGLVCQTNKNFDKLDNVLQQGNVYEVFILILLTIQMCITVAVVIAIIVLYRRSIMYSKLDPFT